MTVFLQLLLAVLPQLLRWLAGLQKQGKQVSGRAREQLAQVLWYTNQLSGVSAAVGVDGAAPPPVADAGAVRLDVGRYAEMVDKAVALFEAYSKLTAEAWDDRLAETVRFLFTRLLPGLGAEDAADAVTFGSAGVPEDFDAAALPPWVLPLVLEIAKAILEAVRR